MAITHNETMCEEIDTLKEELRIAQQEAKYWEDQFNDENQKLREIDAVMRSPGEYEPPGTLERAREDAKHYEVLFRSVMNYSKKLRTRLDEADPRCTVTIIRGSLEPVEQKLRLDEVANFARKWLEYTNHFRLDCNGLQLIFDNTQPKQPFRLGPKQR